MPVIPRLKIEKKPSALFTWSFAANIFLCAVVDGAVAGKAPANRLVSMALVSHQLAFGVGVSENDGSQSAGLQIVYWDRSRRAAALDERNDRHALRRSPVTLPPELRMQDPFRTAFAVAIEGFIGLDCFALTAKRLRVGISHRFTDAVHEEPSRLIRDAEGAVDLMSARAFFAGCHQPERQQPFVKRNMRAFEDRADAHRKFVLAR